MKNLLYSLSMLFLIISAYGQPKEDFIFIITLNGLAKFNMTAFKVSYLDNAQKKQIIGANYYTGKLELDAGDFTKMKDTNPTSVQIEFYSNKYESGTTVSKQYEIELPPFLLDEGYFVLNIFDTDKKCFSHIFTPLPGKTYTFEYDSQNHASMRRITKIDRESCDCLW